MFFVSEKRFRSLMSDFPNFEESWKVMSRKKRDALFEKDKGKGEVREVEARLSSRSSFPEIDLQNYLIENLENLELSDGFTYLELKNNPRTLSTLRTQRLGERVDVLRDKLQEVNSHIQNMNATIKGVFSVYSDITRPLLSEIERPRLPLLGES